VTPDWSLAGRAYDALAGRYDALPRENRINAYMRRASLAALTGTFRSGMRVLEIGCGTGDEALALAERGVDVIGIDASEGMVLRAREKAEETGASKRVSFFRMDAREVGELAADLRGRLDGAFASFSLAYEPDLRPVAAGLHELLAADAPLLASVPSRVCFVELLAACAVLRPSLPGRRLRPWHDHKVGDAAVPIRTFTPETLAAAFAPEFALVGIDGLAALVPPAYTNRAYARLDGLADGIEAIDARIRTRFPFRYVGDHFLARFRHAPRE